MKDLILMGLYGGGALGLIELTDRRTTGVRCHLIDTSPREDTDG
jgi:hypothetical protein